jgi:hypothetical protein
MPIERLEGVSPPREPAEGDELNLTAPGDPEAAHLSDEEKIWSCIRASTYLSASSLYSRKTVMATRLTTWILQRRRVLLACN